MNTFSFDHMRHTVTTWTRWKPAHLWGENVLIALGLFKHSLMDHRKEALALIAAVVAHLETIKDRDENALRSIKHRANRLVELFSNENEISCEPWWNLK